MGLFNLFKKTTTSKSNETKINSEGEKLDKLIDGELPWGWATAYADYYRPRDKKLYELSISAANAKTIDDEIACLRAFISYYYQYKNECIAKGECFFKYFSDMHMHCHNSRNPDFDFVTPREERLEMILQNYDSLIREEQINRAKEEKKQELLRTTNVDNRIKEIISSNPGILQTDIYKKFDPVLKDSVSEWIYFAAKDGKIKREKSGRSYQLYWMK